MSDAINVQKVSDRHGRRAEQIEDKLEKQGMGRDRAEQEALRQSVDELGESTGGSDEAGDSPEHASHDRDHRRGIDKTFPPGQP